MTGMLRSAVVIARRDFAATVLSKTFIFFLLGPLFPLLLGGVFGGIGARVAARTDQPVVAVALAPADYAAVAAARAGLAQALGTDQVLQLRHVVPEADGAAQARRLLAQSSPPLRAVISGTLDAPRLTGALGGNGRALAQLKLILAAARAPAAPAPQIALTQAPAAPASLTQGRAVTGQIGQMLLFFLSLLLSGMLLSQLIEEKSNKIIEVIAAAVPIDAMFLGKLFAMLAASLLGMIVWLGAGALLIGTLKSGGLGTLPPPAVGWPVFLTLALAYFAMNYLLLGALFLTIGAQAGTAREVQILSMPVTFAQVLVFGFAATAVGAPGSTLGLAAAVFPWSSPMTMLARAAELPEMWPHFAALAWQALWVAIILNLGARLFRKLVLKSGPPTRWWRFRRSPPAPPRSAAS
ncbi:MAG: ABC transporter permease [Sphingomicrobium sp.]